MMTKIFKNWELTSMARVLTKELTFGLYFLCKENFSHKYTWQIGYQMKMDTRGLELGLSLGSARVRSIFEGPGLGPGSMFRARAQLGLEF